MINVFARHRTRPEPPIMRQIYGMDDTEQGKTIARVPPISARDVLENNRPNRAEIKSEPLLPAERQATARWSVERGTAISREAASMPPS
jgi:hypothetical protein